MELKTRLGGIKRRCWLNVGFCEAVNSTAMPKGSTFGRLAVLGPRIDWLRGRSLGDTRNELARKERDAPAKRVEDFN